MFDQRATVAIDYVANGLDTLSKAGMAITGINQGLELGKKVWREASQAAQTFTHAIESIVKSSPRLHEMTGIINALGDRWTRFKRMVADAGVFDTVKGIFNAILVSADELFKSGKAQGAAKSVAQVISDVMKDTADALLEIGKQVFLLAQSVHDWITGGPGGKGTIGGAIKSGAGWGVAGAIGGAIGGTFIGQPLLGAQLGGAGLAAFGASSTGQTASRWISGAVRDTGDFLRGLDERTDQFTMAEPYLSARRAKKAEEAATAVQKHPVVEAIELLQKNLRAGVGGADLGVAGPSKTWAEKMAEAWKSTSQTDILASMSAAAGPGLRVPEAKGGDEKATFSEYYQSEMDKVAEIHEAANARIAEGDAQASERDLARIQFMSDSWARYYDLLVAKASKWKKAEDITIKGIVQMAKYGAIEALRSWLDAEGKKAGLRALEEAADAISAAASGNWHAAAGHGLAALKWAAVGTAAGVASGMLAGSMNKSEGGGSTSSAPAESSDTATGSRIVSGATGITTQTLNITNNFVFNDMVIGGEAGMRELVYTWIVPALDEANQIRSTGAA